ncbi:ABC transporter substrate-binding protein [Azospirillum sp. SYSU D00513]|uniref:ABC transporter substrate-binding protein n=1 Tax=Azospirillum sp. SYSU D00513 TaxID=2812561 RepID=UPI001FFE97F3|nr:ABC transporter substrate-binding protein [Azospirillum sp. SYSU D00513]
MMRFPFTSRAALTALATVLACGLAAAPAKAEPTVEVLHYWTSGGESKAAGALRREFEAAGGRWIDAPVAGGGGDAASTVLRSRVLAGDPPNAVQLKGPNIRDWAEQGTLASLDEVARAEGWEKTLPPLVLDVMKHEGRFVAVPVNIHRVNWLWINPRVFGKAGLTVPKTWDEFNAAAEKLKAAGITPLAHGSQPWQDTSVFEDVALGIGGADFFRKALVELNEEALTGETMVKVFDQMRKLRGYVDAGFNNRDWNLSTAMLMNGQAAMQIMGDWAKGELLAAGKVPGKDFLCVAVPGQSGYIVNADSFVMFKSGNADRTAGQMLLAKLILGPSFQETFNTLKGSIPARQDMPRDKFDECAVKSMDDLKAAVANNTAVPSMAHEMSVPGAVRGAFLDVVTSHFNSDMTSQEAVRKLAEAIELAK